MRGLASQSDDPWRLPHDDAMQAIVQNVYGLPAVLELKEIDKPVVKDDDVLVRVHAAALHAGDYFIMRGVPYLARFAAGWPKPKDYVPGFDLAGHVEAIGAARAPSIRVLQKTASCSSRPISRSRKRVKRTSARWRNRRALAAYAQRYMARHGRLD